MSPNLINLFSVLKQKEYRLAFITAGGGAGLFDLFKIPGASRFMSEAGMLYDQASFERFLEDEVTMKYVSRETADRLCSVLMKKTGVDLCFALTCALVSDRSRRSADQGFLVIGRGGEMVHQSHFLIPGGNREEQDLFVTETVCRTLCDYLGQHQ